MNKALFLDRDGVINKEIGDYLFEPEKLEFNPGLFSFVKKFALAGYKIIVITNQGGIVKGYYEWHHVQEIHRLIQEEFHKHELHIDDFFMSVHHDSIGASLDRKPGTLMLERAVHRYNIDVSKSLMIGDKVTDVQAAERMGIRGIKITANQNLNDLNLQP